MYMCHVCPVDFVCKERKIIIKIIIILTKTIVFTIVMVKPNNKNKKTVMRVTNSVRIFRLICGHFLP